MISGVFANSIDFDKVKVVNGRYLPFQANNVAMAPNGNIYFPNKIYHEDFSKASASAQHRFIHEMTHVWQFQRRHNVFIDGMKKQMGYYILGKDPYSYNLDTTKKLSDYNLEQQADIIADYYSAFNFQSVSGEQPYFSHSYKSNERHKYVKIMFDFLKDSKDASSLPIH